jgi:hypothetical protein
MIACERCHRLRRQGGLHICLEKALAARASTPRPPAMMPVSRRLDSPAPISSFALPGNGPAARVWNALALKGRAYGGR